MVECINIALSQTQWPSKCFTLSSHSPIHTLTAVSAIQGSIQLIGVRCHTHGHLHTWSGGTRD